MPRTHGYAPQGQRCHGTHDWHARGRTNVIGALIGCGLLTVGLFSVNIDADVFTAWVKQELLPKLTPSLCAGDGQRHLPPKTGHPKSYH
jgi:hypothetical protein